MIGARGVGKWFGGVVALDGVSLNIPAGDFLVLLGPSGCGKSTLLRLIAGLEQPDSGVMTRDTGQGGLSYVFQDPTLMPWATALENVSLPLRLRGDKAAGETAAAALARVGLAGFLAARPSMLSGGMRMRVSIARALVTRPSLLLMDEPFAALDEFTRHALQDQLLDLTAELGCTTVLVTHSLYEAAYLARRVALMTPRPGRLAEMIEVPAAQSRDRLSSAYAATVARLTTALHGLHLPA